MASRFLVLLSITLSACGGSSGIDSTNAGPQSNAPPGVRPGRADEPAQVAPPSASIVVHNGASDAWLLRDYQAPLWLEIDGGLQLNGYGQHWCDQDLTSHNEPAWRLEKLEAGATLSQTWDGKRVIYDGDCWRKVDVAPGKHTARACIYDTDAKLTNVSGTIPAGPGNSPPPSAWFTPAPTRCVDFTIDLPQAGAATVDVTL